MPLYDFRCNECAEITERLTNMDTHFIECPKCTGMASRLISTPTVKLDGTDPGFPGEYAKWAKKRAQHMKLANKRNSD